MYPSAYLGAITWLNATSLRFEDWDLSIPLSTVEASLRSFYKSPKSPGLIILEHELSDQSVTAFIDTWDVMRSNKWNPITIADATNTTTDSRHAWYQNGLNDTANVVSMSFGAGASTASSTASPGTGSSSSMLGTITRPTGSGTLTTSATQSTTKTGGALLNRVPSIVSHPSVFLMGLAFLFINFA